MITEKCAEYVTTSFKNRWRTLMSVDDVIEEVVTFVEDGPYSYGLHSYGP